MNTYISSYRKRKVEPKTVSVDAFEDFSIYDMMASSGATPEVEVLDRLADAEVEAAVQALPEQFRITVLLADVEGFKYAEIAEITGVSVGTVMSRLHRGRKALQRSLWNYARSRGLVHEAEPWDTPRRNATRS
jgi:RNA polymerase sigma-70 factor (ECF subfamily)